MKFTNEDFEDVIEIARDDVKHAIENASMYPDLEITRIIFYLQIYSVHLAARLAFNGFLNGTYKSPKEGLSRMKELVDIEHGALCEQFEDGTYISMEEMENEESTTPKSYRH